MTSSQAHKALIELEATFNVSRNFVTCCILKIITICLVKKQNINTNAVSHYVEILFVRTNGDHIDHIVNLIINGKFGGRSLLHENFMVLA